MSFTKPLPRLACLLLLLAVGACEGRTAMRISPCTSEGATRACTNTCGDGVQTCKGSSWTGCVVPPVRSSCSNSCGDGTRLCQDNQLASACEVDPVRLPCSNTCGNGTQLCQNNLKGVCEVDPVRLPCSNTCGDGTQLCENNQIKGVCEVAPVVKDCSTICGPGNLTCADNKWQACTATQPKSPALTATIRDFHITFPDMNHDGISETGIVATQLGDDDKPVYAHTGSTATVVGPDTFNQWYRDVAGVNISTTIPIPLTPSNSSKGVYTYNNTAFFPIDGQLFGDEGQPHNYAFTAEVAAKFRYSGGETFTFAGDDDVFVFINRQLAIDLGGIHSMLTQTVDLDAQAGNLGLTKGQVYPMHIFFAERHMTGSDFVIETTISEFDACK